MILVLGEQLTANLDSYFQELTYKDYKDLASERVLFHHQNSHSDDLTGPQLALTIKHLTLVT